MVSAADLALLRPLAERYAAIAHLDVQRERLDRYRSTNNLERPRPVVLIDEVPWGEIRDESLVERCAGADARALEQRLRRTLYQWAHFPVDLAVPPVFRVTKRVTSTGIGLEIRETRIESGTGSYAAAHHYADQLATDDDLARLRVPAVAFDRAATARPPSGRWTRRGRSSRGSFPSRPRGRCSDGRRGTASPSCMGSTRSSSTWRPGPISCTALRRFTDIGIAVRDQCAGLGLLDAEPVLIHCTPARTRALPPSDRGRPVGPAQAWGRCAAQIFSGVSPAMHDEFDLAYNQELFAPFGLVYHGCCEPLHHKSDLLRRRFPNLRKVSVTPWADPDVATDAIGKDFVLAAKPNPALVAGPRFDPDPVEAEITGYLEAVKRNGTTCEFVLKDISTISGDPGILTHWAATVARVIDRYARSRPAAPSYSCPGHRPVAHHSRMTARNAAP